MPAPRSETDGAQRAELGATIRRLRKEHGLTLVQLAKASQLSHPFLSQLERGLTHPSMRSLYRIAIALGTTQQSLLATSVPEPDGAGPNAAVRVVRAGEGPSVPNGVGTARVLGTPHLRVHPVEYRGLRTVHGDYYSHPGDEFVYVLEGEIEVDLGTQGGRDLHLLGPGDSISYPGGTPHSWRAVGEGESVDVHLLAVQPAPHPAEPASSHP
jgi:mannose-6-phosphate isomerase-like protein (cupin superfamily)/DNA-binding XRE family transcriptional regulator